MVWVVCVRYFITVSIPSGLECFGCVLTSSLKKTLLLIELFYRASSELLGEVVVGEEPIGRRSVELTDSY